MPTIPKQKDFRQKSMAREPKRDVQNTKSQVLNQVILRLFQLFLQQHPLCQLSLLSDRTEPANHIHHLIKWADQPTEELKWKLLLDEKNVIAVTDHMHNIIHYRHECLTDAQAEYLLERKTKVYSDYLSQGIIINLTEDSNIKPWFQ